MSGRGAAVAFLVAGTLAFADEPVVPVLRQPSPAAWPDDAGAGGDVELFLTIDETGRVIDAEVQASPGEPLTSAALAAAKGLLFEPMTHDGGAVGIVLAYRYHFTCPEQPEDAGLKPGRLVGKVMTKGTRDVLPLAQISLSDGGHPSAETDAYLHDSDQEGAVFSSGTFPTRMRAGERLALRGTRVPLSRGLGCPEMATPCPLTDGDITEVDAGMIEEVSLNLAAPAMVSAVVLRGAWVADDLIRVVLVQNDGGTSGEFEGAVPKGDRAAFPFGVSPFLNSPYVQIRDGGYVELKLAYVVIPLDAGTPTSRVTLQFPAGLARIKEVSVF